MNFPELDTFDVQNHPIRLPAGLEGVFNLVVATLGGGADDLEGWIALGLRLAGAYPALRVVQLSPTPAPARKGLRQLQCAQMAPLHALVEIPSGAAAFLVARDGALLWHAGGPSTYAHAEALDAALHARTPLKKFRQPKKKLEISHG